MSDTETTPATVQELAELAGRYYKTTKRGEGNDAETITVHTDDAPEWVQTMSHDAHGDMLPDDWKFARIAEALEAIAEADDLDEAGHEFADNAVDVYNSARSDWLASNLTRAGYCDEAAEEFGTAAGDGVFERIGLGQYAEASEIYGSVLRSLEARLEELEQHDDETDD